MVKIKGENKVKNILAKMIVNDQELRKEFLDILAKMFAKYAAEIVYAASERNITVDEIIKEIENE